VDTSLKKEETKMTHEAPKDRTLIVQRRRNLPKERKKAENIVR